MGILAYLRRNRDPYSDHPVINDKHRVAAVVEAAKLAFPPDHILRGLCQSLVDRDEYVLGSTITFVADKYVEVRATAGIVEITDLDGLRLGLPMNMCVAVVAKGQPIAAPNVDDEALLAKCIVKTQFPGFAGWPIRFRGLVIGSVSIVAQRDTLVPARVLPALEKVAKEIETDLKRRDKEINGRA